MKNGGRNSLFGFALIFYMMKLVILPIILPIAVKLNNFIHIALQEDSTSPCRN